MRNSIYMHLLTEATRNRTIRRLWGVGFLGCRCGGCAVDTGIVDGKNPKVDGRKLRRRTASRFVEALRLRTTDDWPRRRERLGADRYTKARFQSSLCR